MKKLFVKKLMKEIYLFRNSLIKDSRRNIIEKSYKIDTMFRMYDLVRNMAEKMSAESMAYLLLADIDIIESLYVTWLKREDTLQEELKQFVEIELYKEVIRQKEFIYGERFNNTVA